MSKIKKDFSRKQFALNEKGQAALFDSIFFLIIVSTICTALFFFAINYGVRVDSQISSFYSSDFATDALKVISYVNTLRSGENLSELANIEYPQFDYLLAAIKEDYAENQKIGDTTSKSIVNTLDEVMKPFNESIDYAFHISSESNDDYLFFVISVHECIGDIALCNSISRDDSVQIVRNYYLCEPLSKRVLEEKVFPFVGKIDSAFERIGLARLKSTPLGGQPEYTSPSPFIMQIDMWVSKNFPDLNGISTNPDFNCSLFLSK